MLTLLYTQMSKVQTIFNEHLKDQTPQLVLKLQDSFDDKMRNLEDVIRKQEDLIVKLQSK